MGIVHKIMPPCKLVLMMLPDGLEMGTKGTIVPAAIWAPTMAWKEFFCLVS